MKKKFSSRSSDLTLYVQRNNHCSTKFVCYNYEHPLPKLRQCHEMLKKLYKHYILDVRILQPCTLSQLFKATNFVIFSKSYLLQVSIHLLGPVEEVVFVSFV